MTAFTVVEDGRVFFIELPSHIQKPRKLDALIDQCHRRLEPEASHSSRVKRLVHDLTRIATDCLRVNSTHIFGSSVNGFRTARSDVDILFVLKDNGSDPQLRSLVQHLKSSGQDLFTIQCVLRNASVPIVTVYHRNTGLSCDISFSVPALPRKAVIHNSNLLRTYAKTYPEVAIAFKFLKTLLGLTKYSSARTGGLSTYGHIILYLYYLTHHQHYPLIDPQTFEPHPGTTPDLTPSQIILRYLHFLACQLDSSQYIIDIKAPEIRPRCQQGGHRGRLLMYDPYVKKNLGTYMSEGNLYEFKVLCYRLLELLGGLEGRGDVSLEWLEDLCSKRGWDHTMPPLHQNCYPTYAPEHNPRNTPSPPSTPLVIKECTAVTLTPSGALDVSSTLNQRMCDHKIKRDIPLDVFGTSSVLVQETLTADHLLPTLVVFFTESLVEEMEVVLNRLACENIRVSSCFTKHSNPNIHLTTYYGLMEFGSSDFQSYYVYSPSMNVPVKLWEKCFTTNKPLYFLVPEPIPEGSMKTIAQRYIGYGSAQVEFLSTVPTSDLRMKMRGGEEDSQLPHQLQIYRVSVNR